MMTYLGTLFKNLLRANLAIKIHICRTFPVFLCHLIEINATSAATSKTHSNLLGYQAFICFLNCICLHLHLISSRPIMGFAKILAVMNIHSHLLLHTAIGSLQVNAARKNHKLAIFINPSYLEKEKMYTFA